MKKITALLVAVLCVFSVVWLVSCTKDTMGGHTVGKLVYNDGSTDYQFEYPEKWQIQKNQGMVCLYVGADDPSNVSISTFGLGKDEFKTLEDYISGQLHSFQSEWNAVFGQTDFGEPTEITLGGEKAIQYIYPVTINTVEYKYMQVFTLHHDNVYTLTYAARAEVFDSHLQNVNQIIESFEFK